VVTPVPVTVVTPLLLVVCAWLVIVASESAATLMASVTLDPIILIRFFMDLSFVCSRRREKADRVSGRKVNGDPRPGRPR